MILLPESGVPTPDWRRCAVTHNPVATDTWMLGRPCKCASCQAYCRAAALSAAAEYVATIEDYGGDSGSGVLDDTQEAAVAAVRRTALCAAREAGWWLVVLDTEEMCGAVALIDDATDKLIARWRWA